MRKFVIALLLVSIAATASAQSPAMKPFEINMDRVKISNFGGNFGGSKTYLIPTVNLVVSARGSVWAKSGGAKAHGKYYVDGLSKPLLQELARKIQDDLVSRMRAAGYTVLTYEDVKAEPDIAGHSRNRPDEKYCRPQVVSVCRSRSSWPRRPTRNRSTVRFRDRPGGFAGSPKQRT